MSKGEGKTFKDLLKKRKRKMEGRVGKEEKNSGHAR